MDYISTQTQSLVKLAIFAGLEVIDIICRSRAHKNSQEFVEAENSINFQQHNK